MGTKELWIARDDYGYHVLAIEPELRNEDPDEPDFWWPSNDDETQFLLEDGTDKMRKVLGLPIIRLRTKKLIKMTVEVL